MDINFYILSYNNGTFAFTNTRQNYECEKTYRHDSTENFFHMYLYVSALYMLFHKHLQPVASEKQDKTRSF